MALTIEVIAMLVFTLAAFWGVATWSLVKTLRQEDRKAAMLEAQERVDTYPPKALAELRAWIEANPNDSLADEARQSYNECVDVLESTDEHFYDWSESEVQSLDRL